MSDEFQRQDSEFQVGQKALYKGEEKLIVDRRWQDGEGFWEFKLKGVGEWVSQNALTSLKTRAKVMEPLIKDFGVPLEDYSTVEVPQAAFPAADEMDATEQPAQAEGAEGDVPPAQSSPNRRKKDW